MPKGKRKGKSDRHNGSAQTSDDDSFNDTASVLSNTSEVKSLEGINNNDDVDEVAQVDVFEDKLIEALDGLTQKSAQGRTASLDGITKAFTAKFIPDFVSERRLTVCDGIERGLKKGRGAEQEAAARLAPLLCVQLGASDASEEVCRSLKPILLVTANDKSVQPLARAKCCTALGLITFLAGGEMGDVVQLMQQFEAIFAGSYLKGDGTPPTVSAELGVLHAAALSAWSLLFTLMSSTDVYTWLTDSSKFAPSILQLSEVLLSSHLDVRIAAGEALVTVFELGRERDEDFAECYIPDLVESLRQLATDSHKYRAKKDRKQQRATFRDIVGFIENDQVPDDIRIKFGSEVLILDSWTRRKQYDSICTTLGSGLNNHLAENELLRDIFELGGRKIVNELVSNKQSKLERHLVNAAAFKARSIVRGKNRDKRSDF